MMRALITVLLVFIFTGNISAQSVIKGLVTDDKQKPVQNATVLLLHAKDSSLVLSGLTAEDGSYGFINVLNGKYLVSITFIGHAKAWRTLSVDTKEVQVPVITLAADATTLANVTVVSTKPFLEQRADKLVVNVENSATAAGSTALEILQKVPGIIVRNDQVTLAGKNSVTIMIDGKISQYTDMSQVLGSMSAANIEKIELITNPGAKYDAAGGAIINIIIKKNANLGTNGNLFLSTGMGLYQKGKDGIDRNFYRFTPSFTLNHREGKLNIYGSVSMFKRNLYNYSEFDRLIGTSRFEQVNYSPNDRTSYNYRLGADLYADKKNTFGILFKGFDLTGITETTNNTRQSKAATGELITSFQTLLNSSIKRDNLSGNINWKHSFDSTGKELNVDIDYSGFQLKNSSDIFNQLSGSSYTNNQFVDNPVKFGVLKIDQTHPFNKNTKLDAGAKMSIATINNYLVFKNSGIVDPSRSTDFEYHENINAAYASLQHKMNKWEFIAGMRAEQTVARGLTQSVTVLDRNYIQFFPSVFLTRNINKDLATTIQYSRRVNRPSYQQQNPFIEYLDSLTYTRGNPLLRPELTDAYKLSLNYQNQPFIAISYNRTSNVIFENAPKQVGNITYTTPENLAAYDNINIELNFPIEFGKKISGYGGNQFIYNRYKADYLGGTYNRSKWNWQAYWQITYKPKPGWSFECSGFYTTQFLEEFIDIGEMSNISLALQKAFLEKRARLSLNVSDVFFNLKTRGSILYQDINVSFRQWSESRNIRLVFSYSFGNQKLKAARNRSTGSDAEAARVKSN